METYVAEIGEIVRAQRRDEEVIDDLSSRISKVVKDLLGQRRWIRWFPYFRNFASTAYYANTVLACNQTLGEEYVKLFESEGLNRVFCRIISSRKEKTSSPTLPQTLSLDCQFATIPKLVDHFLNYFLGFEARLFLKFKRLHLAIFYIYGAYYSLARRWTGIRFLSVNPQTDLPALKLYRFLGYVTIAQLIVSCLIGVFSFIEEERKRDFKKKETKKPVAQEEDVVEELNSVSHPWFRCSVCLEQRDPSALFCGHLFCWTCIQEHALPAEGPSRCPQCRLAFEPRDVTPLLNL
ncbi:unnamed protein product [Caenorhabditis auriculariae]|uniref:RING-type E3 ubiquitin transferase n=1 Tax=Caenorhabditis auriculariae TaxID=2777116 RepID=A0A8S1H4P1_9PELO|nr:unnamed protein product [Caenorhabditis auriculariae]